MFGLTSNLWNKCTRRVRIPYGSSFPKDPKVGELYYRTDLKAVFIFIGVGEVGTSNGWFNLKQAVYA